MKRQANRRNERHPILPLKDRVWQTASDWARKNLSETWEYTEEEIEEIMKP